MEIYYLWPNNLTDRNRSRYQRLLYLSQEHETVLVGKQNAEISMEVSDTVSEIKTPPVSTSSSYINYTVYYFFALILTVYRSFTGDKVVIHTFPGPVSHIGFIAQILTDALWVADILDDPSAEFEALDTLRPAGKWLAYWVHVQLMKNTLQYADHVLVVGTSTTTGLAKHISTKYNVREDIMIPLPNGVNLDSINKVRKNGIVQENPFTIYYVGSLKTVRGIDTLLRAVGTLNKKYDNIRLELLGPTRRSKDKVEIQTLIEDEGIVDITEFSGERVPHKEALERMACSNVCVLPLSSRVSNYQYTYPIKLFEYMAMGKPIVASRLSGISEIVSHEATCLLATPDNEAEFAQMLERLYLNEELRKELAEAAKQDVAEFSWEQIGSDLLAEYPSE